MGTYLFYIIIARAPVLRAAPSSQSGSEFFSSVLQRPLVFLRAARFLLRVVVRFLFGSSVGTNPVPVSGYVYIELFDIDGMRLTQVFRRLT